MYVWWNNVEEAYLVTSRHWIVSFWFFPGILASICNSTPNLMPGVDLMVRVVGLGSWDPEFKCHSAVELIPGGVDSACHPSEVGIMSACLLVSCVGVVTRPGLCPTAKETCLGSTNALHRVWSQWMDGWMDGCQISYPSPERYKTFIRVSESVVRKSSTCWKI